MKRALLVFVVAAFVVTVNAQTKKPDFSGLWIMVSPEAGTQLLIKQDAATFTSGPPTGQEGSTVIYKLDGTESRNVVSNDGVESVGVAKASWNDAQLAIANTITWRTGEQTDQLLLWSINDQNQLVLEVQNKGSEPRKMIYQKQH